MMSATDTVKDNASEMQLWMEFFKAFDKSGDALSLALGIDDKDDGSFEPYGKFRRAAWGNFFRSFSTSIEESHHAFDKGDIPPIGMGADERKVLRA